MKTNKLVIVMMVLLLISILISLFSIYTIYQNRDELLESVQKNVRMELARYDIPTSSDLKIEEAQILLAVAKYCETRNDCHGSIGPQGIQGQQGIQGIQGLIGVAGIPGKDGVDGKDGYTPVKGVDYFDGQDGQDGLNGRDIEQRCNQDRNRVEWKYEGDENWTPLYNLSPLQTCATEERRR